MPVVAALDFADCTAVLQAPERRDLQLDERLQIRVLHDYIVLRVSAPSPDWIAHKV